MKYNCASDALLTENGFDPSWIDGHREEEGGPFAVFRELGATCRCCGGDTSGWTVVNLETATGIGASWTHDGGEVDAHEHAGMLNYAWLQGHAAGSKAPA